VTAPFVGGVTIDVSRRIVVALLLLNVGTTTLEAQSRSHAFIDASIGGNVLLANVPANDRRYEKAPVFAFLAIGNQGDENSSLFGALHLGLLAVTGSDTGCGVPPLGGCDREFPVGGLAAITVGGRPLDGLRNALEAGAGPALMLLQDGEMSFGALATGRVGLPRGRYLSPGLMIHVIAAPVDGTMIFAAGVGLSLRTW
jgi:hypothetical protein